LSIFESYYVFSLLDFFLLDIIRPVFIDFKFSFGTLGFRFYFIILPAEF